jgi:hypothetical protein
LKGVCVITSREHAECTAIPLGGDGGGLSFNFHQECRLVWILTNKCMRTLRRVRFVCATDACTIMCVINYFHRFRIERRCVVCFARFVRPRAPSSRGKLQIADAIIASTSPFAITAISPRGDYGGDFLPVVMWVCILLAMCCIITLHTNTRLQRVD